MRTVLLIPRPHALWLLGTNRAFMADSAAISMGGTQAWTVTGWMSMGSSNKPVLFKGTNSSGAATTEYYLGGDNNGAGGCFARSSDNTTLSVSGFGHNGPLGKRAFYAGGHDGANVFDYRNNSTIQQAAAAGGTQDGANALNLGISNAGQDNIQGHISRVGLWKRALTATEFLRLYNGGKGTWARELPSDMWTNLVDYWDLNVHNRGYFSGLDWTISGSGMLCGSGS